MRSITVSSSMPRIRRKMPRFPGLYRRFTVRAKLRFSRSASMAGGATTKGLTDIFGIFTAFVSRGWQGLRFALAAVGALTMRAGGVLVRPLEGGFAALAAGLLKAKAAASTYAHQLGKRQRGRLAPALFMLAVTCMIFSTGFLDLSLMVSMDGVPLGFVQSREEVESVIQEVEVRVAEYLGTSYSLNPEISYTLKPFNPDNVMDPGTIKSILFTRVNETDSQYMLSVDGSVIAVSHSKATLESMLGRIKATRSYIDGDIKTEFVQNVRIEETNGSVSDVPALADIEALLTSNSQEVQTYTIQNGDTISRVASSYNMSIGEIKMLNPELNIDKISIGEEIQISAAVPFLSLKQTRTEAYEEDVPFETIIEYTDTMYKNQSKITTAGVPGSAAVVADVVYVDGRETGRDILEYTVLVEPVTQVKLQGTKELPAKAPTGSFRKPSSGVFTSGYGRRKSMGDFHTGVDFAGKVGTAIWASDGGTVTFAGWKGTYGYCVIIDHGNGFTTLYAHCSSLLVSSGQKVAKGENIAKVGSTGRSTGPHVHFEIKINGKNVNPLNYIGK